MRDLCMRMCMCSNCYTHPQSQCLLSVRAQRSAELPPWHSSTPFMHHPSFQLGLWCQTTLQWQRRWG